MFVWYLDGDVSNDCYDNLRWYHNKNDFLRTLKLEQNIKPEPKTKVKPKAKAESLDSSGIPWTAKYDVKDEMPCVAIYRHRDEVPYTTFVFEPVGGKIESSGLVFEKTITPETLCKKVLEAWMSS